MLVFFKIIMLVLTTVGRELLAGPLIARALGSVSFRKTAKQTSNSNIIPHSVQFTSLWGLFVGFFVGIQSFKRTVDYKNNFRQKKYKK